MGSKLKAGVTSSSRRSFLKATGLAAVGSAIAAPIASSAADDAADLRVEPSSAASQTPVEMVNLLQGTESTPVFSRGNTLPIAALPFGMGHWTLESRADHPWMFQPKDHRVQGFRCTHQLSPWLSDYGYAVFLPFSGEADPAPAARASSYRPEDAKLSPHSLELYLLRYRIRAELVPTERCAVITATYEDQEDPGFMFDIPGTSGIVQPDVADQSIAFQSLANSGGVPENFAAFYVLRFDKRWKSFELKEQKGRRVGVVRFEATVKAIEVRIATSFISFHQANRNLDLEIGHRSVVELRESAAKIWNQHLTRVEIEGGSEDQRRIFYSCLYRTLLFPRIWHEPDDKGQSQHFSPYTGKLTPGVMYADHGYWDVYRAWYPLMSILFPERLGEILQAWVNVYKEGGWLPQFPCPGYRACMTGSLIDSVFGDAAAKGIRGFDLQSAYEGLRKHATTPGDPAKGYGRVGLEEYLKFNYVPADHVEQSAVETADAAYGDFCIAQVAKALGKQEDYAFFMKRSENWRNLFDSKTGFLRGKNEDGSWLEPFDKIRWGSPYVEGSAWQHRWDVPHNLPGLFEAMGGKDKAVAALDKMLALPPAFHVGAYGQEIHEMSEMAAVKFGQYAHSNQPVHHVLYIFAAAGRPDRTQYWVRRVMQELYTKDTFAGDEDTGSMAAWFVLSSLGFYPSCPGRADYTFGSPLFDKATIHLDGGKTLLIEARQNSQTNVFVKGVKYNGEAVTETTMDHARLVSGGKLVFDMFAG
ncbi:GH92 family glycosyl hydrolase [Granulicella sp. S190]|uniref:GH92 family glycosyl hydrolase n=1 Tax=Granulicella sp. S190 TaxID=1747226 RepID=UPI00131AAB09|nr:GH92 family glycosyl hydrolase [Granulicella sp. S190]